MVGQGLRKERDDYNTLTLSTLRRRVSRPDRIRVCLTNKNKNKNKDKQQIHRRCRRIRQQNNISNGDQPAPYQAPRHCRLMAHARLNKPPL